MIPNDEVLCKNCASAELCNSCHSAGENTLPNDEKSKIRLFLEGVLDSLVFVFTFGIITIGDKKIE